MKYIMDGAGVDSPECRQLRLRANGDVNTGSNVPAIVLFDAQDAFIEHDGPENHYRPYMMILGRPAGVQADMPYDVTTLRYQSTRDQKLVAYRYDFTRENLEALAAKGLFDDGFEPSDKAKTSRYELPCEISYVAFPPDPDVEPEEGQPNPPVIFASLQSESLHCNDETSGYTIHKYFNEVPEPEAETEMPRYELPAAARVLGENFTFKDIDVTTPGKIAVQEPETAHQEKQPQESGQNRKRPGRAVSIGQRRQKPVPQHDAPEQSDFDETRIVEQAARDVAEQYQQPPAPTVLDDEFDIPAAEPVEQPVQQPAPKPVTTRDMSGLTVNGDNDTDEFEISPL